MNEKMAQACTDAMKLFHGMENGQIDMDGYITSILILHSKHGKETARSALCKMFPTCNPTAKAKILGVLEGVPFYAK